MKNIIRISLVSLAAISIAVLGAPQRAAAVFNPQCLTPICIVEVEPVHTCSQTDSIASNGSLHVCSASADVNWKIPEGGQGTLSPVDLSTFPPVPGGDNPELNFGATIGAVDANGDPISVFYEICFPDPGGFKVIYLWVSNLGYPASDSSAVGGHWVAVPSYGNDSGGTCTKAWVGGTYAVH
jgi:hypothetical protein